MQYLKELEDSVLIDMLAQYTERFTHFFYNFAALEHDPEYQSCKETIQYIILELYQRGMLSQDMVSTIQNEGEQSLRPL